MKNITVIGSGTMGNGIAHVFAQNNYKVNLIDVNDQRTVSNFIGKDSKDLGNLVDQEFLWFTATRLPPVIKINSNKFRK